MDVIETDKADVQVNEAGTTSYVNNYKIMDMLGEGTFSKVYLCQDGSGSEFALKIINKSILKRKREYKRVDGKLVLSNAFQKVQQEVAIMKKLAHPNLVKLYEVIDSPADDKLFLVLELIRGGQIMYWDDKEFRYLARNTPTGLISKDTARECLRDVVAALDFLHHHHICHRDIKPENILISGNQYKLADFGVAYMNEDEPSARAGDLKLRSTEGTYHFLAPECTTGDKYDPYQVDVWALGVTMFILLVGTLPFGSGVTSLSDIMTSIREDLLILPSNLDHEWTEMLTLLMEKDPQLRITVQQLKTHPWILKSRGEIVEKPLSMKMMLTQHDIEAAFTPVNSFILVMKLKMKMSSRLNNVRKMLANTGSSRIDAVSVSKYVPVPSAELIDDGQTGSKSMEMAPSELSYILPDRQQTRSSRIVESISQTVGSLTASLGKNQLGSNSLVLEGLAYTASTPESYPSKTNANLHGTLRRSMSKLNSNSVRSLFTNVNQRTDNTRAAGITSKEQGESSLIVSNGDKAPTNSSTKTEIENSPNVQTLTKRKSASSASFRGFLHTTSIEEGESTSEPTSPDRKKRKESRSYTESDAELPVQHEEESSSKTEPTSPDRKKRRESRSYTESGAELPVQHEEESSSKTDESSFPLGRLSRKKTRSFRTLITTRKSFRLPSGDGGRTDSSLDCFGIPVDGIIEVVESKKISQVSATPSMPLATTRPREISLWNSRSTRTVNTSSSGVLPPPGINGNEATGNTKQKSSAINELNDELLPFQNAKLPALDMNLTPVAAPVTPPATFPRRASSGDSEETLGESMVRRRSSSPTQIRRVSLRVSPLRGNRSTLLPTQRYSSSLDQENTQPDLPDTVSPLSTSNAPSNVPPATVQSSPTRRCTIAGVPTPPWSPKRLQRNKSIDEIEDINSAFTRMSSLAKVLDACIPTDDGPVEEPTSPTQTFEAPSTPLSPTRRHQVQVPPLLHESDSHNLSPLSTVDKPFVSKPNASVEGVKSPIAKYKPQRKSLLETQDSILTLHGGKRPTRVVQEKHFGDDMLATIKSKACNIM
ncbi:Serine/threonine protein kinase [Phytophthora megakarya]|uniref:Serine/threonine protein kinase n=1 Tax=Phytophthora megakarya TaxID=4795 RepID=A0A225W944_9STRA|nr:Serine/threonine protein kinase [Phytophthora megakarya]